MVKLLKNIVPLILLTLIPTISLWLPFFLRIPEINNIPLHNNGMQTIVSNYDGPLYLVVAKTLYNIVSIKQNYQFPLPVEYYAAHFPLFPLLIKLVGEIIKNYPYAMLLVTLASSFLALYFFNKLVKKYLSNENSLWLTLVFSIFPARFLIVRSIGSPEPLFLASIIASIYYFDKKNYWLAGFWGAVATLTKSPGILLFVAFLVSIILSKINLSQLKKLPIILIPSALLVVFLIYKIQFNNFFAYFNSGDNIHLLFPPFQIFNYSAPWVGTFWLEEIVFVYLFGVLGLLELIKQKQIVIASFVGVFFTSIIFVSHRDILRYSLPIVPFVFLAFSQFLIKKEFKIALIFLIIPIYLFSLAFISGNTMPISNWAPFL